MLEIFAYRTVTVVQFTDQNWISKTVYCIRCVRFCKIGFISCNAKIALLRASMLVTYYIKLFRRGIYRHNAILMFLLLLVAKKKSNSNFSLFNIFRKCSQKCLREVAFKPFKFVLKDFFNVLYQNISVWSSKEQYNFIQYHSQLNIIIFL